MLDRVLTICLIAASVALIAGCNGAPKGDGEADDGDLLGGLRLSDTEPTRTLVPQAAPPISDVPVPVGFKLVDSISRSFDSAGLRFVDHTYLGLADRFAAEKFYAKQMPARGWQSHSNAEARGTKTMRFRKGDQFAEIRIEEVERGLGSLAGRQVQVHVLIQTINAG